ncbi:MAG TPA: Gfo/Idh/MocA family oxidoreductase [Tepidisphaeraceae bacterium]|jgi:predicted dehydrogenase|nr:Gfo/Idh/MocA family oxidoreductase [Tepidisphaeraceae bacterium]
MTEQTNRTISRRDFHKRAGQIAAASALSALVVPHVFAAEDNTINLALIGCGGRGTGAVVQALKTSVGPTKLTAMVDVFQDRLDKSYKGIAGIPELKEQIDVPPERKFIGFDGYQKAMDSLKKGDVAILTTPPAFRWVQFTYAIKKGLNVFMEKPVTVDGPTTRRMYKLGEEASAAGLKVGVGLMCRHCKARAELFKRIKDGEIGDIVLLRAYRQHGPVAECFVPKNPGTMTDTMYQIRNFHAFLWASGGLYSDFYIHNIDESCWMMDKSKTEHVWPVMAQGTGGRNYRGKDVDQNFDSYNVEYTFDEGAKLYLHGRTIAGAENRFASYAHGTKGSAVISSDGHTPAHCKIYKNQKMDKDNVVWAYTGHEPNPYDVEWEDLMTAIRKNEPYNEVRRGADASLVTSMGRMSAHTAQPVKFDDMFNCKQELAPEVDKLTADAPPPVLPDKDGKYPVPQPGRLVMKEYEDFQA